MGTKRRTAQAQLGRWQQGRAEAPRCVRYECSGDGAGTAARGLEPGRISPRRRRDFCSFGPRRLPSRLPAAERRRRRRRPVAPARGRAHTHPAGPGAPAPGSGRGTRPGLGDGGGAGGGGGGRAAGGRESSGGERRARRRRFSWRTVIEERSICWDVIKKGMNEDKTSKCKHQNYNTSW